MAQTRPREERRTRRGGRAQRGAERATPTIEQLPWGVPENLDAPVEPLDGDGVQAIHNAAMEILEDIGIWFLHEDAKKMLKEAGADVDPDSDRVRFDRAMVMEHVARAPEKFVLTPRNPDRAVPIGGNHMAFVNVSSPPNSSNLDRGRRAGTREDFQDLVKLSQYFNCMHLMGGYPVEPVDIHASIRHLDCVYDKAILTDKVLHAYCLGKERVEDAMEIVRISCGLTHDEFDAAPRMYTNINSSSPLKHDTPMLDGGMRMARRGQPVFFPPLPLSGAMAPVTLAGAPAPQTAEGMAA
ncbi:MAG: trimethylamine methyltransferase family protein, partial [Hyphomicrobiaceae bacterium]